MIENHLPNNCYSSSKMDSIDGAVIHFISAKNIEPLVPFDLDSIINIFKKYKVSAHYLIDRKGEVIELVPKLHRAYHAGKSLMNGRSGCNNFTIGIELMGGTPWPYTDEQMLSLGELLARLMTEHQFTLDWVQGHDRVRREWNEMYPDKAAPRKVDPGDHFNWEILNDMLYSVSQAVENNNA